MVLQSRRIVVCHLFAKWALQDRLTCPRPRYSTPKSEHVWPTVVAFPPSTSTPVARARHRPSFRSTHRATPPESADQTLTAR
ncbi:hypothetical protein ACET3X_008381 [Alternaria dauci]|uniref:Uncharacterized protein n=1 Tax=Alternaria dauci TaxID=48095 RepID=A0ABR3UCN6_9PLEO